MSPVTIRTWLSPESGQCVVPSKSEGSISITSKNVPAKRNTFVSVVDNDDQFIQDRSMAIFLLPPIWRRRVKYTIWRHCSCLAGHEGPLTSIQREAWRYCCALHWQKGLGGPVVESSTKHHGGVGARHVCPTVVLYVDRVFTRTLATYQESYLIPRLSTSICEKHCSSYNAIARRTAHRVDLCEVRARSRLYSWCKISPAITSCHFSS